MNSLVPSTILWILLILPAIPFTVGDELPSEEMTNEIIPPAKNKTTLELPKERGRLISTLMANYDKTNYPTGSTVKFGLALTRFDIDERKKNMIEADLWLRFVWQDPRLQWDEADFGGENVLRLPSDKVWVPDILLYNAGKVHEGLQCFNTKVLVYSNGEVLWVPPCHVHINCNLTLDQAPYGDQTCQLKFGSWTMDGFLLDIQLYNDKNEIDLSEFGNVGDWEVTGSSGEREVKYYSCCDEPYVTMNFGLTFRRRSSIGDKCTGSI